MSASADSHEPEPQSGYVNDFIGDGSSSNSSTSSVEFEQEFPDDEFEHVVPQKVLQEFGQHGGGDRIRRFRLAGLSDLYFETFSLGCGSVAEAFVLTQNVPTVLVEHVDCLCRIN